MTLPTILMTALGAATIIAGGVMVAALAIDKRRARQGRWRTPERTLHTLELCGGWLGSLLARRMIRHKSRKRSYRLIAAAISILHLVVWAALIAWAIRARG